jgi:hypothetical protein
VPHYRVIGVANSLIDRPKRLGVPLSNPLNRSLLCALLFLYCFMNRHVLLPPEIG